MTVAIYKTSWSKYTVKDSAYKLVLLGNTAANIKCKQSETTKCLSTQVQYQDVELHFIDNSVSFMTFIYLFGVLPCFHTVQVISGRVVGRTEETSTYSWSRFCTVNCQPTASNYQLFHLRLGQESNSDLRGGRRECYHSATVAPLIYI